MLRLLLPLTAVLFGLLATSLTWAHSVAPSDIASINHSSQQCNYLLMVYLGAKHMVTGIDHILFLCGVMFLLSRWHDVIWLASLFALGHSITLVTGSLFGFTLNHFLTDAVIGLSVAYKALDNLFVLNQTPFKISNKVAVFSFGLIHGLGLASRIEELNLKTESKLGQLISFNIGVEIGQLLALTFIISFLWYWQKNEKFSKHAYLANLALLTAGMTLVIYQMTGYFAHH